MSPTKATIRRTIATAVVFCSAGLATWSSASAFSQLSEDQMRHALSELRHPRSIEVYDYDQDSAVYWLQYGTGIEFELKERLELEQEGWYVIEDVYGSVIRYHGECGGETDEEWYLGNIRYATEKEIKAECLS